MTRAEHKRQEAHGFVNRKFGGSLKNFLVAFSGGGSADDKEIKELKEWLSELDDD